MGTARPCGGVELLPLRNATSAKKLESRLPRSNGGSDTWPAVFALIFVSAIWSGRVIVVGVFGVLNKFSLALPVASFEPTAKGGWAAVAVAAAALPC